MAIDKGNKKSLGIATSITGSSDKNFMCKYFLSLNGEETLFVESFVFICAETKFNQTETSNMIEAEPSRNLRIETDNSL